MKFPSNPANKMKRHFLTFLKKILWHWQIFQKYQSIARNHDHWVLLILSQADAAKLMDTYTPGVLQINVTGLNNMSSPIQAALYKKLTPVMELSAKQESESLLANLQSNENEGGIQ